MNWGKNFVLLETLRKDKENSQNFLFTDPLDVITCHKPSDLQKCFQQMERYREMGYYLAGFFAYELGYFLEDVLNQYCPKHNYPLLWFGVYNEPVKRLPSAFKNQNTHYCTSAPILAVNYPQYEKAISKIKNCIASGETYQINYTSRYDFNVIGNLFDFHNQLKKNQKVSYSALVNYDGNFIISLSPELFFRIDSKQNITVKPMKGTAPAGTSLNWLRQDIKNTSENIMIVDLLRSDLGRICLPGSVKVKKLFDVEKYETLLQMTSTVTGKLQPQIKIFDIVKSLFPCGSVTGAPKIQSMKIISDLETQPRNIYTGAIGYFATDGQAVFNVAIRTIDLQAKQDKKYSAQMGVGGGIVYDSRPEEEFAECQLKARFLINSMPEFALIETMLFAEDKIQHLNMHLRRLKTSANYFSIPCYIAKIKTELNAHIAKLTRSVRLRLLLNANGDILIQHQPFASRPAQPPVIAISQHKTDSSDHFLYHKSTHRQLYDEEYKKYSAKGYFDVIFQNERYEITEGAISNIFIRLDGHYYTPPLHCGLLNGIQRQVMLKRFKAKENTIFLKDLKNADKIILTNSVRGVTEVIYQLK